MHEPAQHALPLASPPSRTLAEASRAIIAPLFRRTGAPEDKSGGGAFDPVTQADRAMPSTSCAR